MDFESVQQDILALGYQGKGKMRNEVLSVKIVVTTKKQDVKPVDQRHAKNFNRKSYSGNEHFQIQILHFTTWVAVLVPLPLFLTLTKKLNYADSFYG